MKQALFILILSFSFFITEAQNVGIGTNAPTARLQVVGQGNSFATNNLMLKNLSGDTLLRVLDNGTIGMGYNAASYSRTFSLGGNGMNFYNPDNGAYAGAIYPSTIGSNSLVISGGNHLLLKSLTGNVGIGTNFPSVSLDVSGAIATTPQAGEFTTSSTTVTLDVFNSSFRIVSNSTSVDKTIILSDGLADGQRLTVLVRNSGTGTLNFIDNPTVNNTDISVIGAFAMGDDDTISFIWDASAGYWVETGRSDN